jgi:hypothetical protein
MDGLDWSPLPSRFTLSNDLWGAKEDPMDGLRPSASQAWCSYIGTFKSEKDAALAQDVFARKEGRP